MKTLSKSIGVACLFLCVASVAAQRGSEKPRELPKLIGPKRSVMVDKVEIKCAGVNTGSSFSFGSSYNNASGGGSDSGPRKLEIADPSGFGEGMADMMITTIVESKAFQVIENQKKPEQGFPAQPEPEPAPGTGLKPQFLLRGAVTQLTCRERSSGGAIGILGGRKSEFTNKVTMDIRLIDPITQVVIDSIMAEGEVRTKTSFLGLIDKNQEMIGFSEFNTSPLGDAAREAMWDGIKKLIQRMNRIPWEATILDVIVEEGVPVIYLNADEDSGLAIGQILEVFELGKELKDPNTGVVTGRGRAKLLGTAEVIENTGKNIICKPLNGLTVKAGHVMRLPRETKTR